MNIVLWILQGLLAVHTVMGAVWKYSHSAQQTMPSLGAIPSVAWLALSVVEIFCAIGLILPLVMKSLGIAVPIAALVIATEMLLFCGLHLASGDANYGPMIYWLVVTALCAFVAYARFSLSPL